MHPAFALPNLRAQAAAPCIPWEFRPEPPVSKTLRADKKARTEWILNALTRHQCYATVEGINGAGRIAKAKGDSEGNPPYRIHGLVADYDGRVWEDSDVVKAAAAAAVSPAWFERTLSGYTRLVWLFESPVQVDSWDTAVDFLKLALDRVGAPKILPGLDKGSYDPGRYYTNSGEWLSLSESVVSRGMATGWLVEVVSKASRGEQADVSVPLDKVIPALARKYPAFSQWEGEFVEGAQGPSFWVDGSTSPKSALVKPGGIFTFSDHSTKSFWTWSDLLGSTFVEGFRAEKIGQIVDNIWFEPRSARYYFPTGREGEWVPLSRENIVLQLREARGASSKLDKTGSSELLRALAYIQTRQIIAGVGPFVYYPPGPVEVNHVRVLNTCTVKVVQPSGVPEVWGPEGRFPFISSILDALFLPEPLSHVLSWYKVAYEAGYNRRPRPGHVIVLGGAVESGKSFVSNRIFADGLGGGIDATKYLMGEDTFSEPYLAKPGWLMDDASPPGTDAAHRLFTHLLKRVVANDIHVANAKYVGQQSVYWSGRVIQTINDDDESREALPAPNASNSDKICYYRLQPTPANLFSRDREENNRRAAAELPAFVQWILDYQIPEKWLTGKSVRMGIIAYHDPEMKRAAEENGEASYLTELIVRWRGQYFSNNPDAPQWEGTTTDLMRELQAYESLGSNLVHRLTPRKVGCHLRHVSSTQPDIMHRGREDANGFRLWRTERPGRAPRKNDQHEKKTVKRVARFEAVVPNEHP